MTSKPNTSRRLWPYLAVPALAVAVAATIYVGDFSAEDAGLGGSSDEQLPGSQIDETTLSDSELQPDPAEQHAAAEAKLQGMLAEAVDAHLAELDDENLYASVAVSDGEFDLDYSGAEQHDTASIVKVEILGMLLLEYESVEEIPGWAVGDAAKMIKKSDNDATNDILFGLLDGHATMREAHEVFGLDGTEPGQGERWGLTQTTASDQLTLLEGVLYEGVLNADQAELARSLMGDLADFQQWGVSSAAEDGETVWMKNGWDTRNDLGGEWVVNSIGVIGGDSEEPIMMSILTGGSASEEEGIALAEALAQIARDVVDTDPYA
ncbi:class A beta-lactamase-related serine hydrolase [Glycomyces sp. L485]|uniref:class A beta-lactamase-related serine hydrolase n=1 Tax=Glycomyces sp. L485 TaxID=2909235 RepID=UPI001F4BBEAA|nr:class A beta-lactamase-related serine hydrolase [Glycomyces sp. L485]MCH7229720.1 class A beta-lactamase-related serine hydrolase [Glycomyces sp. L485]